MPTKPKPKQPAPPQDPRSTSKARQRPSPAEAVAALGGDVLAIAPDALPNLSAWGWDDEDDAPAGVQLVDGVAVVEIRGAIMQRGSWWCDGYDQIAERLTAAMFCDEASAVVIKINSPGGACAGMIETLKALRSSKAGAGKPVIAFADETAFSAAYCMAIVADAIWLPASGAVGSVGVMSTRYDETKLNERLGVRVEVVTTGDQKADGHPDTPITTAELKRYRERVAYLGNLYADEVAAARGMTREAVLGLEAGIFYGEAAVAAGLADKVGSLSEAIAEAKDMAAKAAGKAKDTNIMKTTLSALGLPEGANEADVAVAIAALKTKAAVADALHAPLAALTAKSAPGEIVACVEAFKASSVELTKVTAEKANLEAEIKKENERREVEAKAIALDAMIAKGRADGKLTKAQADGWAKSQTAETLGAFLEHAPVVVTREQTAAKPAETDPVALTAEERQVAKHMGIPEDEMLKTKARRIAAQKEGN